MNLSSIYIIHTKYDFEIHYGADCRTHDKMNKKKTVRHWMQLNNAAKANWIDFLNSIQFSMHCIYYCLSVKTWINVGSGACLPIKYMKNRHQTLNHMRKFWSDGYTFFESRSYGLTISLVMRFREFFVKFHRATGPSVRFSKYQFSIFNNMTFCHYQHLLKWKMHLNWYVIRKQKRNWKPNAFANGIIHCVNVIPIYWLS